MEETAVKSPQDKEHNRVWKFLNSTMLNNLIDYPGFMRTGGNRKLAYPFYFKLNVFYPQAITCLISANISDV